MRDASRLERTRKFVEGGAMARAFDEAIRIMDCQTRLQALALVPEDEVKRVAGIWQSSLASVVEREVVSGWMSRQGSRQSAAYVANIIALLEARDAGCWSGEFVPGATG